MFNVALTAARTEGSFVFCGFFLSSPTFCSLSNYIVCSGTETEKQQHIDSSSIHEAVGKSSSRALPQVMETQSLKDI